MDNEALNTDQTKDNVAEETESIEEPRVESPAASNDALSYAPNDPFAPPKEREVTTGEMPIVPIVSAEDAANPEIGGDIEVERVRVRRRHPVLKAFLTLFVLAALVCGGCCAWLVFDDDRNASCHVPEGVTLDGDDVGGLSANEVKTLVERHILNGNVGTTMLNVNGQEYSIDFARLGTVNVAGTVDVVMNTIEPDRVKRCVNRALGLVGKAPTPQKVALRTVCAVDEEKVAARVESIAMETNVTAVDAGYSYDIERKTLKINDSRAGQTLNVDETIKAVMGAAENGLTTVNAAVTIIQPKKSDAGYAVFVNRTRCFLYVYKNGQQVRTYACSPGPSDHPTPEGNWTVSAKDEAATTLELSCGGGISIVGTDKYKKLGSPRGEGSVYIGYDKAAELFDMLDVGSPVFVH